MASKGMVRNRLTRDDWAQAALAMIAERGVHAVAVEPIARRLGATKGSFYWHLRDRNDLVGAALELWERRDTESQIADLSRIADPFRRFEALRKLEVEGGIDTRVDVSLLAAADDPVVRPVLQRVLQRRVDFLLQMFREMGFSPTEASDRAHFAFASFMGRAVMGRGAISRVSRGKTLKAHLDRTAALLTGGQS